jgi:NH3-dependent NAD+ synthetase
MKSEVDAVAMALGVRQDIIKIPLTDGLLGDTRIYEDQFYASYD